MRLYKDVFTGMLYGDPAVGFEFSDEIREIGEIEIQEPKKTVVKDVGWLSRHNDGGYCYMKTGLIPSPAKNIKITYEVEE